MFVVAKNKLDGIGYVPCSWNVPQEVRSICFTVIYVNIIPLLQISKLFLPTAFLAFFSLCSFEVLFYSAGRSSISVLYRKSYLRRYLPANFGFPRAAGRGSEFC
jgi:hypothetical protein